MTVVLALVLAAIIMIGYNFLKDRNKMLQEQVDKHGGMRKKYSYILSQALQDPNSKIIKEERDLIYVRAGGPHASTNFIIKENFKIVEIEWIFDVQGKKVIHKKWEFPHDADQFMIVEQIGEDMEKASNQFIS